MAEFERALIQERVKAGLAHAVARGKRLGRPRAQIDAERVRRLRQEGWSWRRIAAQLGCADASTLLRSYRSVAKFPPCCENPAETGAANA